MGQDFLNRRYDALYNLYRNIGNFHFIIIAEYSKTIFCKKNTEREKWTFLLQACSS